MRSAPECVACSINQALRTARLAGVDEETQMKALKRAVEALAAADMSKPPAVLATSAILASGEVYNQDDPYREEKKRTLIEQPNGQVVVSDTMIYTEEPISLGDRIWLDGVNQSDPTLARQPKRVWKLPDEDGSLSHYEVAL